MEEIKMKYLSPITVEAEIFLNSLESLSKTYNNIDTVLVSSLEKIMDAIEKFLDSGPSEIVETKHTKLVQLNDVGQIKRIFTCTTCKRDIGKSVENVALHLSEGCSMQCVVERPTSNVCDIGQIKAEQQIDQEKQQQKHPKDLRIEKNSKRKDTKRNQPTKLTKKAHSLLTTNLYQFIKDQLEIGTRLKYIQAYNIIEKELFNLIAPLFPDKNIKVHKFGSRIAGIGHRNSDLDLYIEIGDSFFVYHNRADSETISKLQKVHNALKKNSKTWKDLVSIEKARVPILKAIHTASGIECDLNFSNSLGTVNTMFFEYIFNIQPFAQLLCCFMKKWLNRIKLSEEINTYSMNLLVLFYLQTLNFIPSMERLQEGTCIMPDICRFGHWIGGYENLTLNELNLPLVRVDQPNLLKYIRGFFRFYSNFHFGRDVISPYLGKVVKRTEVEKLMPYRYKAFIKTFPGYELQLGKPLVVQDPLELNHNTTKSVSDSTIKTFKMLMLMSWETLNSVYLEDLD